MSSARPRSNTGLLPRKTPMAEDFSLPSSPLYSSAAFGEENSPQSSPSLLPQFAVIRPELTRSWASPVRTFGARQLDSPVDGVFNRLNVDLVDKLEEGALDSSTSRHYDEMEEQDLSTESSQVDAASADKDPFDRPLSLANVMQDRETSKLHNDYLSSKSFHLVYRQWSRSGNLRGTLVDSVPYSVLRDVMVGMTTKRPVLLYLIEKMSVSDAGANFVKILDLLLKSIDLVHVHLTSATTVPLLVSQLWPNSSKRSNSRETVFVFSSDSTLRRNVEVCIMHFIRTGSISLADNTFEMTANHWFVFVAPSIDVGFSHWLRRECLLSSVLSFGRPVGGLESEVDSTWLSKHATMLQATYQDPDMARWTRDLVTLLRISPYLQQTLVPGVADSVLLCVRACALMEGRTYVIPSDFRNALWESFRHQISAKSGSPYSAAQLLEASVNSLSFPQ